MEEIREIMNHFHRMLNGGSFIGLLPIYEQNRNNGVFLSLLSTLDKIDPSKANEILRDGYDFVKKYSAKKDMTEGDWMDSAKEVKVLGKKYGCDWGDNLFLALYSSLERMQEGRHLNNLKT